jgi:hypothetical protein
MAREAAGVAAAFSSSLERRLDAAEELADAAADEAEGEDALLGDWGRATTVAGTDSEPVHDDEDATAALALALPCCCCCCAGRVAEFCRCGRPDSGVAGSAVGAEWRSPGL